MTYSETKTRILAVSDMHIGAPYSGWTQHIARLERAAAKADHIVLCGDMFEGTMMQSSLKRRIELSRKVLTRLANANPKATVHVIFGNHEEPPIPGPVPEGAGYLKVSQAVREHAATLPNVVVEDKGWVQIGDALFTHGHRELGETEKPPSFIKQMAHLAPNILVPGAPAQALLYPPAKVTAKMHAFLEKLPLSGPVRHVCFGHTHTPYQGYTLEGKTLGGANQDVQFHNLGAAIVGRPSLFQPLVLEQDASGITQRSLRANATESSLRIA